MQQGAQIIITGMGWAVCRQEGEEITGSSPRRKEGGTVLRGEGGGGKAKGQGAEGLEGRTYSLKE